MFCAPPADEDDGELEAGELLVADEPDPEQPAVTAATSARPTALHYGALGPDGRTVDARSGPVNALLADG